MQATPTTRLMTRLTMTLMGNGHPVKKTVERHTVLNAEWEFPLGEFERMFGPQPFAHVDGEWRSGNALRILVRAADRDEVRYCLNGELRAASRKNPAAFDLYICPKTVIHVQLAVS